MSQNFLESNTPSPWNQSTLGVLSVPISTKLSTENSAFKKRSSIVASATAWKKLTADDDGQPGAAGGDDEDEDDEIAGNKNLTIISNFLLRKFIIYV